MLFTILIGGLINIINFSTAWLPKVTQLPFGIDSILANGIGYINFIGSVFPPLSHMLIAFLFYYAFKFSLKFFAMIPVLRGMLHK
jgi:hypothetical protein